MEKEQYITEFVDIYGKLDKIAENKTEVALAIFQEINKDRRVAVMNVARASQATQPATFKQVEFLKRHGYLKESENISKSEASAMIDELTRGRK
ncbi:MAG: hypothetical protein LHV68_09925 [Elusimicrobia bacterium]|nr:hypothetical protein [Candidatus Liberimonas magnetica]